MFVVIINSNFIFSFASNSLVRVLLVQQCRNDLYW